MKIPQDGSIYYSLLITICNLFIWQSVWHFQKDFPRQSNVFYLLIQKITLKSTLNLYKLELIVQGKQTNFSETRPISVNNTQR